MPETEDSVYGSEDFSKLITKMNLVQCYHGNRCKIDILMTSETIKST